jgi:hypothetical protein
VIDIDFELKNPRFIFFFKNKNCFFINSRHLICGFFRLSADLFHKEKSVLCLTNLRKTDRDDDGQEAYIQKLAFSHVYIRTGGERGRSIQPDQQSWREVQDCAFELGSSKNGM